MEARKRRLAGDTARAATTDEVKDLRREARDLKEVVAEQTLELRLLKKMHDRGWGRPRMSYAPSEKLEIIRLVEGAHLSARQALAKQGPPRAQNPRTRDGYGCATLCGFVTWRRSSGKPCCARKCRTDSQGCRKWLKSPFKVLRCSNAIRADLSVCGKANLDKIQKNQCFYRIKWQPVGESNPSFQVENLAS